MRKEIIATEGAPPAIGPYAQANKAGGWIFLSGQIPLDPATGALVSGDIVAQTHRAMDNIGAILAAAGATFDHVVKVNVYLTDLNDFARMNEVYVKYFPHDPPARATVQAAALPRGAVIEIDCTAYLGA